MINPDLLTISIEVLEDMKAKAINKINVSELTSISDHMIFCTGTSSRHARSIVDKLSEKAKEQKTKTKVHNIQRRNQDRQPLPGNFINNYFVTIMSSTAGLIDIHSPNAYEKGNYGSGGEPEYTEIHQNGPC